MILNIKILPHSISVGIFMLVQYSMHSGTEQAMGFAVGAGISIVIFVIFVLVIFIFRRRIVIAAELIKEASKATSANIMVMFFPILQSITQVLIIVFAGYVMLSLSSIGKASYHIQSPNSNDTICNCDGRIYRNFDSCEPSFNEKCMNVCSKTACTLASIQNPVHVTIFLYYSIFEFLWLMFFITAFSEMVI